MLRLFPDGNGLYQDDNATIHSAGRVLNWFQEHDHEFHHIEWPPQSPDLNPIEHLWDYLEVQVCRLEGTPSLPSELETLLHQEWLNIESSILQNLVESMPRRVRAVISASGGPTKY